MSEQRSVVAHATNFSGRYLIDATGTIFVSDSAASGGETVAPEPTHYLLSSLGVCALGSVEKEAHDIGVRVAGGTAEVTSIRDPDDRTRFVSIEIDVVLSGISQDTAERLVGHFTSNCPIYNTLRRGGPISVRVSVSQ